MNITCKFLINRFFSNFLTTFMISPGHQVKCKVMLKVQVPIKVQSISVQYKGRAKTFWTNETPKLTMKEFSGHEQYFSSFQFIFGVQNGPEQLVKPGYYAFDCLYHLPAHLPSSLKSLYGHVVYSVIVQVQSNANELLKKEIIRDFRVLAQLNLNEYQNLKYKIESLTSEIYGCRCCCCTCCKSRVIDMVTVIPCGGYVAGDNIPIFIEVDNKSKLNMENVVCELYESTTFTTINPGLDNKKHTRVLWEHTFNGVPSRENRFFQTNVFLNPDFDFKVLYGCGIIDTKYFIKTTGVIRAAKCITNEIEIMVGTTPFNDAEDLKMKNHKKDVISPLKRIIPGSLLIAGTSKTYKKETTEKDPLLPKKR